MAALLRCDVWRLSAAGQIEEVEIMKEGRDL